MIPVREAAVERRTKAPSTRETTSWETQMEYLTKLYVKLSERKGQTMAEYGLIVGLVAVASITAWTLLGTQISTALNSIAGQI